MERSASRRSLREHATLVAALTLGCSSPTKTPAPGGDEASARAPAVTHEARPSWAPPLRDPADLSPSFQVVREICKGPCAGRLARLTVFRNADGDIGRIRFDGDLDACSHPPRIYYDAKGTEMLAIPEEPVVAGSAEAKAFADRQAAQIAGLTEAQTLGCPDPARCEPARIDGFRSEFPCRTDDDCLACQCHPVDRVEWDRRGGADACTLPGEECTATNGACCDGRCALAR
jgi:hypothetical protein